MVELNYFEIVLSPQSLAIRDQGAVLQRELLKSVPSECFLVGQSFCVAMNLPRYHKFDNFVHIGATRKDYPELRAKYPEYKIHIVADYTAIEALKCLCDTDNPISLKCTFDRALKKKIIDWDDIHALEICSFKGCQIFVALVPFLQDCFDSPMESMTQIFFSLHGLREPAMQVDIGEHNRCDFLWRKTIFEGEGDIKYNGELPDVDPVEQMNKEHERNNAYHLEGYNFYHYKWSGLYDGSLLKLLKTLKYPKHRTGPRFGSVIRRFLARNHKLKKMRVKYRQTHPKRSDVKSAKKA